MAPDFQVFLKRLDPSVEYDFRPISGGLVNITQRAKKTSASGTGRFPVHSSLILKHASPFIAALGEGAPFSQKRQVWKTL